MLNFATMPSIQELNIWGEILSVTIPYSMGYFASAYFIFLQKNSNSTEYIPSTLGYLLKLEIMGLWDMGLTGTTPQKILDSDVLISVGFGNNPHYVNFCQQKNTPSTTFKV